MTFTPLPEPLWESTFGRLLDERLARCIITGSKEGLIDDLEETVRDRDQEIEDQGHEIETLKDHLEDAESRERELREELEARNEV